MDAALVAAPLIAKFHEFFERQSTADVFNEWKSFDPEVTAVTAQVPEFREEEFAAYSAKLIEKCEASLKVPSIQFFYHNVLRVFEENRPERHGQLYRLEQLSLISLHHLMIASRMCIDSRQLRRQLEQAKLYVLDYAALKDRTAKEKREAEEAEERARNDRREIRIISDDEDEPEFHQRRFSQVSIHAKFDIQGGIPVMTSQQRIVRKRRQSQRMTEDNKEKPHASFTPTSAEQPVAMKARMARSLSKFAEIEDTTPIVPLTFTRRSSECNQEEKEAPRVVLKPDPRDSVKEIRAKMIHNARKMRRAQSSAPQTLLEVPANIRGGMSSITTSQGCMKLPALVPDRQLQQSLTNEEEMTALCTAFKDRGVADEPTRKRILKVFDRWRREKAGLVKKENIIEFNNACSEIDELLDNSILVPNRMSKVDVLFRRARKYLSVM